MTDSMIFTFTPNRSDYIRTMRIFSARNRSVNTILITVVVIILLIIISISMLDTFPVGGIVFLGLLFFYLTAMFFLNPASVADKAANDERLCCETLWDVSEDKVTVRNKFAETSCDWGTFGEVYESNEYFMLAYKVNKYMFQFIPKRAFTSPEQLEQFHKLLEEKIRPSKHVMTVKLPEPSRRSVLIFTYGVLLIAILVMVTYSYVKTAGR